MQRKRKPSPINANMKTPRLTPKSDRERKMTPKESGSAGCRLERRPLRSSKTPERSTNCERSLSGPRRKNMTESWRKTSSVTKKDGNLLLRRATRLPCRKEKKKSTLSRK